MKSFPVRVYRKTELHGWQVMSPKNKQGRCVQIRATPKQGCIVLHRIQVRIRLTSASDPLKEKEEQHAINDEKSKDSKPNDVLVVRRRHYILISSKLRSRSLVFKFKDLKSCLQFSDHLVQLNPNQTTTTSMDQPSSTLGEDPTMTEDHAYKLTHEQDMQQVLSYVARLLYDGRFATFCQNLESSLMASEDGLPMLNHLVDQSIIDNNQNRHDTFKEFDPAGTTGSR